MIMLNLRSNQGYKFCYHYYHWRNVGFDLDTQIQTLIFQGEYRKWSFFKPPNPLKIVLWHHSY